MHRVVNFMSSDVDQSLLVNSERYHFSLFAAASHKDQLVAQHSSGADKLEKEEGGPPHQRLQNQILKL